MHLASWPTVRISAADYDYNHHFRSHEAELDADSSYTNGRPCVTAAVYYFTQWSSEACISISSKSKSSSRLLLEKSFFLSWSKAGSPALHHFLMILILMWVPATITFFSQTYLITSCAPAGLHGIGRCTNKRV